LRNLLCYYAYDSDYKTVLKEVFKTTEENEIEESDRTRGRKQNIKTEIKSNSSDIKPFDTSTGNYNILILPFRNPERSKEISSLGENIAYRLTEKNNLQKFGLDIRYEPLSIDYITYEKAKKILLEHGGKLDPPLVVEAPRVHSPWGFDHRQRIGDSSHVMTT